MQKSVQRWITYAIIILVVVCGLWLVKPTTQYTARGIFLPTQQKQSYTPTTAALTFYRSMPVDKDVIGNISVMISIKSTPEKQQEKMLAYATKLAQQHGATGLVLGNVYAGSQNSPLGAYMQTFQAVR